MYHKLFGGRAPSGPAGGTYSAPPDPPAGLKGPTSMGGEGERDKSEVSKGGRGGGDPAPF